jgi:hypothetical protein
MIENINYDGIWWLPDNPDQKVSGSLKIVPGTAAKLSLIGSFRSIKDIFNTNNDKVTIFGSLPDGKNISLYKCQAINSRISSSGFPIESYIAQTIAIGSHIKELDDIRFKRVYIHFSNLDDWVNISGFDIQQLEYTINYRRPEPIKVNIEDCGISIEFEVEGPTRSFVQKEAYIKQKTFLKIEFSEEKPLEDFEYVEKLFRNFLTLGVGVPVRSLEFKGFSEKDIYDSVEMIYSAVDIAQKEVFPPNMLFTFKDVSIKFENYLTNWFRKAEFLDVVYDLYFSPFYNPKMYSEHIFLSLVQAIESYHRRTTENRELPQEEHDQRIRDILGGVPDAHKSWLESRLEYSNEPRLRKRLNDVIDRYPGIIGKSKDKKQFINNVIDTRNYLTHYDSKLKERAATDVKGLYDITQRLKHMLELCFLAELGFDETEIKNSKSYKHLAKSCPQDMGK